jgi:amino acid transporter
MLVMVAAGLAPIDLVGELTSIGTLFAFALVSLGVLVLRITDPRLERPFKTPLVWITAPLGAISAVYLMWQLPGDTWIRLLIWMALGLLIYFSFGVKKGRIGMEKRGNINLLMSALSYLIPPFGVIVYLLNRTKSPQNAKIAGFAAICGAVMEGMIWYFVR